MQNIQVSVKVKCIVHIHTCTLIFKLINLSVKFLMLTCSSAMQLTTTDPKSMTSGSALVAIVAKHNVLRVLLIQCGKYTSTLYMNNNHKTL